MADITKLKASLAGLLEIDAIDSNSTPSGAQVMQWFMDAALVICRRATPDQLAALTDVYSAPQATDSVYIDANFDEVVRIVAVTKGGYTADVVPYAKFQAIKSRAPALYRNSRFMAALTGEGGTAMVKFYPSTPGDVSISYIKTPGDPQYWGTSTHPNFDPPDSWNDLMVQHVAIKAKFQDEEPEQAQVAYSLWEQDLKAFIASKSIGTDGS